jgi:hypothetical protein|tara:strand:+ start:355 stop:1230 length:876 start_codon:yes stop_codon:yes gene_type:complete
MADMTATTMATYLPEVWSTLATIASRQQRILWNLLDLRWQPEIGVGRGDTVNIASFSQNTRSDVTNRSVFGTGASLNFTANTESQVQLVVNQMAYQAHRMPVEMSAQSMPMYNNLLAEGIGSALSQQMDYLVASDNSNGYDAFTAIGTDNVDVTEATILQGETVLNDAVAPLDGRYFAMSPATRASIIQIDVLRNQLFSSTVGNLDGSAANGYMGKIYSLNCYMHADLEAGASGKKNFIGHTHAIAGAAQVGVRMVGGLNIADGLFNEVAGYVVYGIKQVKSGFGREVAGK